MCSSKSKLQGSTAVDHINMNGRPVLQPTCNVRVPLLERRNSLKKKVISTATPTPNTRVLVTRPISPKLDLPVVKRGNHDPNGLNSSSEKELTPRGSSKSVVNKSKKGGGSGGTGVHVAPNSVAEASSSLKYASSLIVEAPGSIAAARREQVAIMQVQRKMKIAHYGRANSVNYQLGRVVPLDSTSAPANEEKRCSFITSNSGMASYINESVSNGICHFFQCIL